MIDMLQNAKDLIAKGQKLGDNDLIQMGMELLEQYSPSEELVVPGGYVEPTPKPEPTYICDNCEHTMPMDKEGRKRCPKCKKHKLKTVEPVLTASPVHPNRIDLDEFHVQIRQNSPTQSRIRYNDNGEPEGIYARSEQVKGMTTNIWNDDLMEGQDQANEILKQFTKISPRTRQPVKKIKVTCESCKKTELMHPIHTGGRSRHLCQKCIGKRSQY